MSTYFKVEANKTAIRVSVELIFIVANVSATVNLFSIYVEHCTQSQKSNKMSAV